MIYVVISVLCSEHGKTVKCPLVDTSSSTQFWKTFSVLQCISKESSIAEMSLKNPWFGCIKPPLDFMLANVASGILKEFPAKYITIYLIK